MLGCRPRWRRGRWHPAPGRRDRRLRPASQASVSATSTAASRRDRPLRAGRGRGACGRAQGALGHLLRAGLPLPGRGDAREVEHLVKLFKQIGVDHCGVADTIGVGTPRRVQAVMERALKHYPLAEVSGHFHDTTVRRWPTSACLQIGIHTFDPALPAGRLPYAKGARATWHRGRGLHAARHGHPTGVDLDALVDAGGFISEVLGRAPCRAPARPC